MPRGLNNRQSTIHRIRIVRRRNFVQQRGAKRCLVSRRPAGK